MDEHLETSRYAIKTLEKALRIYTPSLSEKALADFLADRCDDLGFRDIHPVSYTHLTLPTIYSV